jgi:hypothetical protein
MPSESEIGMRQTWSGGVHSFELAIVVTIHHDRSSLGIDTRLESSRISHSRPKTTRTISDPRPRSSP